MTNDTLFGSSIPSGTSAFTGSGPVDYTLQIVPSSSCLLVGYRWWLPSGGDTTGSDFTFRCWLTTNGTSGTLVSGTTVTGSGTWPTEQWVETDLSTPVALSAGSTYELVCTASSDSRRYIHAWWASGAGNAGVTTAPAGLAFAPPKASALNTTQEGFLNPSVAPSFPTGAASDGEWFSFDVVLQAAGGNITSTLGLAAAAPALALTGTETVPARLGLAAGAPAMGFTGHETGSNVSAVLGLAAAPPAMRFTQAGAGGPRTQARGDDDRPIRMKLWLL